MRVDDLTYKRGDKSYRRVLIRKCYRDNGKIKHQTLANISHLPDHEIEAIKIAFKHKNALPYLKAVAEQSITYSKTVGSCYLLNKLFTKLKIDKLLGDSAMARYALWLVIAQLIDQGSRLSAVRLANRHYGCELLGIDRLCEDDLYSSLSWLEESRDDIEKKLFRQWKQEHPAQTAQLFLYDVSSSYLEGKYNELAAYGYNRDKKKGKKQIVYGLLTDQDGNPLAVEVFAGNTVDTKTVTAQLKKIKETYRCKHITLVGDKGMIKRAQISELNAEQYHYITTLTKAQIGKMVKEGVIQLELFSKDLCEVDDIEEKRRYLLRRNPERAEEIKTNREEKIHTIEDKVKKANEYLVAHPKAKPKVQQKNLTQNIGKLKLSKALEIIIDEERRTVGLNKDKDELKQMALLDGCYAMVTDLPKELMDKDQVHARYKDLSKVEWAFRTEKSTLKIRPIFLRKADRTRGHLLVCLLAYKVEKYLREAWKEENLTVMEGLETLERITSFTTTLDKTPKLRLANPDETCLRLMDKVGVKLPGSLPDKKLDVYTKRKLKRK